MSEEAKLLHSKKISSLTLKTFAPEVTVCRPVKRNKCMSALEKCRELNCIKALSLPELQSNWIKLEKQLPMCMNPLFFTPDFFSFICRSNAPCSPSPWLLSLSTFPQNEAPEIRWLGMHAWAQCSKLFVFFFFYQTHLSHQRAGSAGWLASFLFLALLKFHIEIPRCHSASPAPVTQPPAGDKNQQLSTKTCTYAKWHTHNPNFS